MTSNAPDKNGFPAVEGELLGPGSGEPDDGGGPRRKRIPWFLIPLPIVVTIPWVMFMALFKFVEDVFSIPGALTAAFLLSAVLLAIRRKNLPLKWALLPLLSWVYECLPFTLPGPFDELLTIGGSGMDTVWAWFKKPQAPGNRL